MNVCARRLKDRNFFALAVFCPSEPKIVDTKSSNGTESDILESYGALRTFMQNNPSLKTDLGLRPVFHQKEDRVTGHLFISLLAYHLVHTLPHL